MDKQLTSTPTVQRTLQVIELMIRNPGGITLRDLTDQLDISRSTLFLVLNSLKSLGYVEQSEKRGKYIAGPRLVSWIGTGKNTPGGYDLLSAFYQEVENNKFEETLALLIPGDDGEMVVVAESDGANLVRVVLTVGQHMLRSGAAGCVVAEDPGNEILKNGYAQDTHPETIEVAVPICPNGIDPEAALLLVQPAYRSTQVRTLELVRELQQLAARISYRCGAQIYNPWQRAIPDETGESIGMSEAEIETLMRSPWMARLACVKPDGSPHVVPVWFDWTRQKLQILAWKGSKWADYLENNPQIALSIDEPWKPYRRISISGTAGKVVNSKEDQLEALVRRIGARYLGKRVSAAMIGQVECAYVIDVTSIKGWQGI